MDQKVDFSAPHSIGTTIIGVTYKDGVVLGADSRTSTGTLSFSRYIYILVYILSIKKMMKYFILFL
ncbi:hypothetical protein LR48_Vigan04g208000 [Vigna angularis]|uniref:Proteasome endopeptidase complex n=1 Tax=Phaseolus angularis TaxID=3914 RepID=A0A0L9UH30_PHAAN|nr:hypothetical protein LR48_Vigan04g208000 [Vigna angularis]